MVTSVLDAGITKNLVRLGSRATDERIAQYSLFNLEKLAGRGELDRPLRREYAVMKEAEEDMTRIMNRIQLPGLTWTEAEKYLDIHYFMHADSFREPPFWIAELLRVKGEDEKENGEFKRVPKKGKKASQQDAEITGVYGFWKDGGDIEFIQPRPSTSKKDAAKEGTDPDPRVAFFNELGFGDRIPLIPSANRSLPQLIRIYNVWSMSLSERRRIAESWEDEMRRIAYDSHLAEFDQLRDQYKETCKHYEDLQDEVSRSGDLCCTNSNEIVGRLDADCSAKLT